MAEKSPIRSLLVDAYDAAVSACDPERSVASLIEIEGTGLVIGGVRFESATADDVAVVAIGKAASAMVRGVVSVLGSVRGIAVSNHDEPCPVPLSVGSHPVPDESSLACGEMLLSFVKSLSHDDVVIYLISGGGSSIAVAPAAGMSLEDVKQLNRTLLTAGVPIGGMNEIRASVSRIKGGRLAAKCPAERSVTLVLSDVVGVGPSHVASGPSIGAGMGADASLVIEQYRLDQVLKQSVLEFIELAEPLSHRDQERFAVVSSSAVAASAASTYLERLGLQSDIVTTRLEGEARVVARRLVREAATGVVSIATGETTVTVMGDGVGGRNQEAALAAAIEIAGANTVFIACGTDGIDGATPAAGAVVDGSTLSVASDRGIDLERSLSRNDSHTALAALEAVVVRGDTGTNVGDIWMIARDVGTDTR
jgi:glycerate-2-kinase